MKDDYSCWADSGQILERLVLRIAFRHDDLNHPGGAIPMGYLACMIPDSLRPAAAICSTAALIRKIGPSAFAVPDGLSGGRHVDAVGRTWEKIWMGMDHRNAWPVPVYAVPPR